jgi:hypothetical protein
MVETVTAFATLADGHPFLAFYVLWLIGCIANLIFRAINRVLRTIKVSLAGWPPSHLDADGDFKPEPEKETE